MAVPKKRTTSSTQGQRRSHLALQVTQLVSTKDGALVPRRLKRAAEMGLLNETITVVSESEDPEAWALMREAARELHGAQVHLQIVAVGSAPPNHLDVQVIYGALRSEGVS